MTVARLPRMMRRRAVCPAFVCRGDGAARGIRTPDPIITNDVLYQLSYCGLHSTRDR